MSNERPATVITLEGRATPSFGENPGILITEAATVGGILLHSRGCSAFLAASILNSVPNVHGIVGLQCCSVAGNLEPSWSSHLKGRPHLSPTSPKLFNKKFTKLARAVILKMHVSSIKPCSLLFSVEVPEDVQTGIPVSQERNCIDTFRTTSTQKHLLVYFRI